MVYYSLTFNQTCTRLLILETKKKYRSEPVFQAIILTYILLVALWDFKWLYIHYIVKYQEFNPKYFVTNIRD
jgi:hypothetical protein